MPANTRTRSGRAHRRLAFALGLLGVASPAVGWAEPPHKPADVRTIIDISTRTDRYRLANGLEVLLYDVHDSPFVAVDLWYHVGSNDDPPGRSGLAHLFEHVMFDGSRAVRPGEHETMLYRAGAREINAETTQDHTAFYETVPADALALALWLEADRMAYLPDHLDWAQVERERIVVENEFRQRYLDAPYGMVYPAIQAALFPAPHPHNRAGIGTLAELESATLHDAKVFFRTWYVPSNCTLALVGDFDVTAARRLIDAYFGPIAPGREPPARPETLRSPLAQETRLVIEADVPRARVIVSWPVVPRFAPGLPELELGGSLLQGYLSEDLVAEKRLAAAVSVSIDSGRLASAVHVSVDVQPGKRPEEVLGVITDRIGDFLRYKKFKSSRFEGFREPLAADLLLGSERHKSRAEMLQLFNQDASMPDYAGILLSRRRSVGGTDILEAYRDLLPPDRRVVTFVVPTAGAPRSGRVRKDK